VLTTPVIIYAQTATRVRRQIWLYSMNSKL